MGMYVSRRSINLSCLSRIPYAVPNIAAAWSRFPNRSPLSTPLWSRLGRWAAPTWPIVLFPGSWMIYKSVQRAHCRMAPLSSSVLPRVRSLLQHLDGSSSNKTATMAPLTSQSTYKMVSGYEIPIVGFGVGIPLLSSCQDITRSTAWPPFAYEAAMNAHCSKSAALQFDN